MRMSFSYPNRSPNVDLRPNTIPRCRCRQIYKETCSHCKSHWHWQIQIGTKHIPNMLKCDMLPTCWIATQSVKKMTLGDEVSLQTRPHICLPVSNSFSFLLCLLLMFLVYVFVFLCCCDFVWFWMFFWLFTVFINVCLLFYCILIGLGSTNTPPYFCVCFFYVGWSFG